MVKDIAEKFESYKKFKNREEFEKVIKAILYFANIRHPDKKTIFRLSLPIGFDSKKFIKIISYGEKSRIYGGNFKDCKKFIENIFLEDIGFYTPSFIGKIQENVISTFKLSSNIFVLDDDKLSDILFSKFQSSLKDNTIPFYYVWDLFELCKEGKKINIGEDFEFELVIREDAKEIMTNYIIEEKLHDFFKDYVYTRSYTVEGYEIIDEVNLNLVNKVFENVYNFISRLKVHQVESEYKKYFIENYDRKTK